MTDNKINSASAVSDGILLIDKEQEWTSFDVVAKLRNVLHIKKIGHAGTLDPMATGLLIILIGRATKLCEQLTGHDKEYIAEMTLGIVTDTQDIWGNVLERNSADDLTDCDILKTVNSFKGEITQLPPMYSAIKVKGERLYNIARRGEEVERKPRKVNIFDITVLARDKEKVTMKINCSSGTYIRTLCHDIGIKLGCGACMSSLRRTRIGDFLISDAHKVSDISDYNFVINI